MTIEQRLEKLERTVRRYQLAFGVLGLALLATTAIACSQQALGAQNNAAIPEVIRARKFEVIARNGTKPVTIGSMKSSPGEIGASGYIIVSNEKHHPLCRIGAAPNAHGGGQISLFDGQKMTASQVVILLADPQFGGIARFCNGLGKRVAYIGSGKANQGVVTVSDTGGTIRDGLSGSP